jgi:alanyl aminopeptidase
MLHALAVTALLATAVDAAPAPPTLRLPGDVRPVRQAVDLHVDPGLEPYSGEIDVELEVTRETPLLWLNATGLKVTSASLGPEGRLRPARVVAGGDDFVGFAPEAPLAAGRARLRASFEGTASRLLNEGLFAMKEGDEWYAFTQFEPVSARRAFPCFDEPAYKIPWDVTLRVPRGQVALSNAPVASTTRDGDLDVVRFAPTRPLPAYLVAVAVGPFEVVDLGRAGRNATPTRLVVPKGRGADTAWARESTPPLLALLENYFDRPYPYEKLDQVAIPGVGFAMEHPGLVTYGMGLMVQRPGEESIASRRGWASVCAHELAHQWFGDLVTMAWWDDTWLNESFASWMGEKTSERFQPDWGIATQRVASRSGALEGDSLATARRVRQPIGSKNDIDNAFDGITYAKGEAVLEMVEAWLGEEAFRRGVRLYLERHAWGNATASDFLSALSAAAGRDVAAVLLPFLDQTGAPVVSAEARCDGRPRLVLAQRPYRALGSSAEPKAWQVPVCAKVPGRAAPACTLLAPAGGEIALDACPGWAYANAGATGYYRTLLDAGRARRALSSGTLSAAERVALAGDVEALVASGDLPAGDALGLLPLLAQDPERQVVQSGVGLAHGLESAPDVDLLPHFEAFVRSAFGPRARQLGLASRPGEDEDTRLLRRSLVSVVGRVGRDAGLQQEALARARRWLDEPSSVDPDMLETVLAVAAAAADRPLVDRLKAEVLRAADRERRQRLFGALGALRDPALAGDALALTLDERLDAREAVSILFGLGSSRETRRVAFDFLKSHYDALARRLPQGTFSATAYLPWVAAGLCTSEARQEIEAFFRPRATTVEGGPRVLDQVLESVDQCRARTEAQGPSVAAFLRSPAGTVSALPPD